MIQMFSIGGCVLFLILAFVVGVLKEVNVAPSIRIAQIKKIRKKDKFIRDVAVHLLLMSIACLAPLLFESFMGTTGKYIGVVILVMVAIMWSTFVQKLDNNIKIGKY